MDTQNIPPPWEKLEFHHLANVTPMIEGEQFDGLAASIKANGLREPIILYEGQILDGRNRYRACQKAGVIPKFKEFAGTDPIKFVLDMNVHRRHLTVSQRAMVAARLATIPVGVHRGKDESNPLALSVPEAAALMNISKDAVTCARTVIKYGTEQEIAAVDTGIKAASTLSNSISKRVKAEDKFSTKRDDIMSVGKNRERQQTMRMNADLWMRLKEAFTNITALPSPQDMAGLVLRGSKTTAFTSERLDRCLKWLTDFKQEFDNARTSTDVQKED